MNKKRLIITSLFSIILVSILLIGSTYSIFTTTEIDENTNVYKTGNLNITYKVSSNTVHFTDTTPMTEEEADAVIPYRITVTNSGNVDYQFDVILEDTTASDVIDYQYIMTKVGYLDSVSLSNCTNNIIKEDVIVPAGQSVDIDIRLWLDSTLPNTEMGKSFYAKLKIDGLAVHNNTEEINNDILSLRIIDKLVNDWYDYTKYFKVDTYRNYIKTASFVNYVDTSNASIDEEGNKILWDLTSSENSINRIIAWLEEKEVAEDGTIYYDLYIGSNDKIYINNFQYFFASMTALETVTFDNLDFSICVSLINSFRECSALTSMDVSDWDTSQVTDMSSLFDGCKKITSLDVSNWDTSQLTSMAGIFKLCSSLTILDVSKWDISKVTSLNNVFNGCSSLTKLDVSNFDTSNITSMLVTFGNCSSLTELDVSNFDTSNVTTLRAMFYGCKNLTYLDVSNFDTSKVENTSQMFEGSSILIELDVSNWNTSSLTTTYNMFKSCNNIVSLDVSNWDTSNFINMSCMFQYMYNLESLDLSNWELSKVTNMSYIFDYCYKLTTIITISSVNITNYSGMFYSAATAEGASIKVYYVPDDPTTTDVNESTESLVNSMVATKSSTSNVTNAGCYGNYCPVEEETTEEVTG